MKTLSQCVVYARNNKKQTKKKEQTIYTDAQDQPNQNTCICTTKPYHNSIEQSVSTIVKIKYYNNESARLTENDETTNFWVIPIETQKKIIVNRLATLIMDDEEKFC